MVLIISSPLQNFETIRAIFVLGKVRYIVPNNTHLEKSMFPDDFLKNSFILPWILLVGVTCVNIRHTYLVGIVRYMAPNYTHLNNSYMEWYKKNLFACTWSSWVVHSICMIRMNFKLSFELVICVIKLRQAFFKNSFLLKKRNFHFVLSPVLYWEICGYKTVRGINFEHFCPAQWRFGGKIINRLHAMTVLKLGIVRYTRVKLGTHTIYYVFHFGL